MSKKDKKLQMAKEQFIEAWGVLGTSWGINKTMAQILALLFITPDEMSVEEIMEELQISRGNVSMNLRTLMDWKLIKKSFRKGERKEFFYAEKDFWSIARTVAAERRKKELEPVLVLLSELQKEEIKDGKEAKVFKKAMKDIKEVVEVTDSALKTFINSDKSLVAKLVMNFMKK